MFHHQPKCPNSSDAYNVIRVSSHSSSLGNSLASNIGIFLFFFHFSKRESFRLIAESTVAGNPYPDTIIGGDRGLFLRFQSPPGDFMFRQDGAHDAKTHYLLCSARLLIALTPELARDSTPRDLFFLRDFAKHRRT